MIAAGGALLLVDDEPQLARVLAPALTASGFKVTVAQTGEEALALLTDDIWDVMVLDLGLPDIDGKTVITRAREWSDVPIIILSARDQEAEKIAALDLGADDFIAKPFAIGELLARLRVALRGRENAFANRTDFEAGDLRVNFSSRRVFVLDQEVHLTPREFDLVRTLARKTDRVLTHRQLVASVWGPAASVDAQFVRVLVAQIRQKIEEEPSSPRIIVTEPGVGYRLVLNNAPRRERSSHR